MEYYDQREGKYEADQQAKRMADILTEQATLRVLRPAPHRTVAPQQSPTDLAAQHYQATVANRIQPAGVIPRVRRIAGRRHAKKPNWVLAMDIFCVGSNYAWGICRDAGLDPEATR